jgi:hypothetical protein
MERDNTRVEVRRVMSIRWLRSRSYERGRMVRSSATPKRDRPLPHPSTPSSVRQIAAAIIAIWMAALLLTQLVLFLPAASVSIQAVTRLPLVAFRNWVNRYMAEPLNPAR